MRRYGIHEIGVYVPSARIVCAEHRDRLGISEKTMRERTGFTFLARKSSKEDASDMACKAVLDLMSRTDFALSEITCLMVVTQNPDGFGIPQVSALVHGKMNLSEAVASFDLSLGCSGYVYGLAIMKSFLASQDRGVGVLITADPYSKIIDADDRDTAMIFGDAATATLVSDVGDWRIGETDFGTLGSGADYIQVNAERVLRMNGKAVARNCVRVVPQSIKRALKKNNVSVSNVDHLVLHQGSKYIVESIGDAMGMSEKAYFMAGSVGNTSSSSIPISLRRICETHPAATTIALSSFGVGLSWASTVIDRSAL